MSTTKETVDIDVTNVITVPKEYERVSRAILALGREEGRHQASREFTATIRQMHSSAVQKGDNWEEIVNGLCEKADIE